MSDFLETFSIVNLGALRAEVSSGAAENNEEIVPGVYLSWDEDETQIDIIYDSPDWASLSLDYTVQGTPRWLSLNLALGEGQFEPGDVIGLVLEGYAAGKLIIPVRLRSSIEGETFDTVCDDTIAIYPNNGVSTVLMTIEYGNSVAGREGYHTLMLGLPAGRAAMTLRNMRVFRMPGSRGLNVRHEKTEAV